MRWKNKANVKPSYGKPNMTTTPTSQIEHKQQNSEISLAEVITILLKHKLTIIGISLTCAFFTGLHVAMSPQEYEAETLILVSPSIVTSKESNEESAQMAEVAFSSLEPSTYGILALSDELVITLADTLFSRIPTGELNAFGITDVNAMISMLKGGMRQELLQKNDINVSSSPLLKLRYSNNNINLPLVVVNTWSELFLQRNQGLSSNVTDDFYQNVKLQYEQAKYNLERAEDDLAKVDATSNELNRLNTELTFKNSRLEKTLKTYQQFQAELSEKSEDYAFVTATLERIENENVWIGYLNEESLSEEKTKVSERENLLDIISQIRNLDKDSVSVAVEFNLKFEEMNSKQQLALVKFEEETELSFKELQGENLKSSLEEYRTQLASIDEEIADLQARVSSTQEILNEVDPVLTVSKAITDNALWNHAEVSGNIKKENQRSLGEFQLVSEEVNPVYVQLKTELATRKNELNYLQKRKNFFKGNTRLLEKESKVLYAELLSLRKKQYELNYSLETERFLLKQDKERKISDISLQLQLKRKAFQDYRSEYETLKTQQEELKRELLVLQNSYIYNEKNYLKWRDELFVISVKVDSLDLNKRRLERDIAVYTESFNRLAKLREEARIARQQAAGDIQIVSEAKLVKPVPNPIIYKALAAFSIAFFAIVLLVLLYESVKISKENLSSRV